MTKSQTKSQTKKKTSTKAPEPQAPEPMDISVVEVRDAAPKTNAKRVCYALRTLVKEVHDLFPETPAEYSNYDGRNTALDATFDLTVLDPEDGDTLKTLLGLVENDKRVASVVIEESLVLVSVKSSPRTQDSREPFGLDNALSILDEWAEGSTDSDDFVEVQRPEDGGSAADTSDEIEDGGSA